jgi:hypothetical protein
MPSLIRPRTPRRLHLLLGAGLLSLLGACASPEQAGPPTISPLLAAGWEEHTRPLINHGAAIRTGNTVWMVPNILPRGSYR